MASTAQTDIILDAVVAALSDIDVTNTYEGGANYRTTVETVSRTLRYPNSVESSDRPALYVGGVEPARLQWRSGERFFGDWRLAVHGYIPTKKSDGTVYTESQQDDFSHDLRADVIAAIAKDIRLGGVCIYCLPEETDASEGRPKDADDGWIGVMLNVKWYGSRSVQ